MLHRSSLIRMLIGTLLAAGLSLVGAQSGNTHTLFLPLVLASSSATTPPQPQPQPQPKVYTGDGTYYDATGDGNCMFGTSPNDMMVAALNTTDYADAGMCGAYIQITGPKGTVVVRIVDRCPECAPGDVDLSREAFAKIAEMQAGRVPISWYVVSPDLSSPIVYRFKEGSNQWWTAVQVRNHRNPIASLEYRQPNGEYKKVGREMYNYFVEYSGMGPGPYTFRVTDIYGNVLVDSGIKHVEGGTVSGKSQFPAP